MSTTAKAKATSQRPRKPRPPKPDEPCVRINSAWVLLRNLPKMRESWPTVRCGGCPRPAFGLFAITIHRGIPGDQKTAYRTLCSRCALGNKLDPRKRPWIQLVFQIDVPADVRSTEALIDAALGIGFPHDDPAGRFLALRQVSNEDPAKRSRTILEVLEAPSARKAVAKVAASHGHVINTSLLVIRIKEALNA